jgi:cell shape-determining protein MreD
MIKRKNNYQEFLGIALVLISIWSATLFAQFSLNLNFYKFFNMTYLLIYFFTFNNYKYFSFFSMFILGLITDSISGIPFGTSSLAYMTIYKIAVFQETIKVRTNFFAEWVALGIALLIAYTVILIALYLSKTYFEPLIHIYNFIGSFILYPFIWLVLKFLLTRFDSTKTND